MEDDDQGFGDGSRPSQGGRGMIAASNAASSGQRKAEVEARTIEGEYAPFMQMEEILEKLKMLNYESRMPGSFRPLSRSYFAIAGSNPAEQFLYFTALCSWLMSVLRINWNAPTQMDDPNSAVASLYAQLQQIGAPCDFPPQKLRHGYGEHCCRVLEHLIDKIPIEFKPAEYNEDMEYEEAAVDEDAEVGGEEMPDEVGAADVEEEEFYHGGGDANGQGDQAKLTDAILDSTVEPEAWRIELERVTPQLKMQVLSDPKEWRNRLASTKTHQQTVAQLAPETFQTLDRLSEDLERTIQAVHKAEQKLSAQCQGEVAELQQQQEELQRKQEEYNVKSEKINELTRELTEVSDALQQIRNRMDERGSSMTDTTPLIKIRTSLSQLKEEAKQLDIRIGVVTHTLIAKKLKRDQLTKAEVAMSKQKRMQENSYLDDDLDD